MPKTLEQITSAARRGEELTVDELRFAVCAYDVLLAQLQLDRDPEQLHAYFGASTTPPELYLGENNHPDNPDFREWYATVNGLADKLKKTKPT